MDGYDLIGDIHGHAQELKQLLTQLDYAPDRAGIYRHPEGRRVIFCGDLIDRGPDAREVLRIVRNMVDNDTALIVMGNHEYNMICYHTWIDGYFLRPHTAKNAAQISATLKSFNQHRDEWLDYVEWFKTIPLYLELEGLRVVHACWDQQCIDYLNDKLDDRRINPSFLYLASIVDSPAYCAVENILKGWEAELPDGQVFHDKEGNARHFTRVRWWPVEGNRWKDISIGMPQDHPLNNAYFERSLPGPPYSPHEKPVFFGHYWMKGDPQLLTDNICCLDYSVAKGGTLMAYRWNGEQILSPENFVSTRSLLNKRVPQTA